MSKDMDSNTPVHKRDGSLECLSYWSNPNPSPVYRSISQRISDIRGAYAGKGSPEICLYLDDGEWYMGIGNTSNQCLIGEVPAEIEFYGASLESVLSQAEALT